MGDESKVRIVAESGQRRVVEALRLDKKALGSRGFRPQKGRFGGGDLRKSAGEQPSRLIWTTGIKPFAGTFETFEGIHRRSLIISNLIGGPKFLLKFCLNKAILWL